MKMTPKEECLILSEKNKKLEINQTVIRRELSLIVMNELVRKFSEMKLMEAKSSCRQLFSKIFDGFRSPPSSQFPSRKRKLSDGTRDGNCFTVKSTRVVSPPETKDVERTSSTDIVVLEFPLCEADLRKLFNQNIRKRIKPTGIDKAPRQGVALKDVLELFENSVLFLQRASYQDIDSIVVRFSDFGTVLNIQNHWVKAKGCSNEHSTVWAGASVFYKTQEDLCRACKAMSLSKPPIVVVPLVDHLTRIHSMEMLWRSRFNNFGAQGTTVVIEGFQHNASKLRKNCGKYGKVLQVKWLSNRAPNYTCEVVYNSTWSAVAAALALDGNYRLYRCGLKARIKVTSKEWYIHRYLCEMF